MFDSTLIKPPAPLSPEHLPWESQGEKGPRHGHASELSEALSEWCRSHRISEAAAYERIEAGWLKVAEHSLHSAADPFPRQVSSPGPGGFRALEGSRALELSHGLVFFRQASEGFPAPCRKSSALLDACLRICRLERQLKAQSFQARYRGVELEALYDVGLAIASTLDLAQLSEDILLRAVSLLDARRGGFYERVGDCYVRRSVIGGEAAESLPLEDVGAEPLSDLDSPLALALLPRCRHALAVAIDSEGRRRGLLVVGDKESRHGIGPFTALDGRTLSLFAHQAAIALENAHLHQQALEKERMERDMELAAEIQREILPKRLPDLDGYEVFGWNQPARQVGGDYYDVRVLDDGRVVLVVADVSGKGVPAALMVATLHSALLLSLDGDRPAVEASLLEHLNRHLLGLSLPSKFITLLLVELDLKRGRMRYLNAGHNPGLLLRSAGGCETLDASGPPLGLLPDPRYRAESRDLLPGDLLCLYSDGITECTSPAGEEYGVQRLEEALRERLKVALPALGRDVETFCTDFAQGQLQGDDQTVLLLRRS